MKWRRGTREADTDLSEPPATTVVEGPGTGYDCMRCGRVIGGREEARRTASGDWVHIAC